MWDICTNRCLSQLGNYFKEISFHGVGGGVGVGNGCYGSNSVGVGNKFAVFTIFLKFAYVGTLDQKRAMSIQLHEYIYKCKYVVFFLEDLNINLKSELSQVS